jgi:hypothetical protein
MAAEGAVERRERARVWLMLAAGSAIAAAEAWLAGERMRLPERRSLADAFVWAVVWVVTTVSGGAVAAWGAGMLVRGRQAASAGRIWRGAAVAWAFLPCLVLLALRGSWWALPVAAAAAMAAAFRLRPVFRSEESREDWVGAGAMGTLAGLPPMGAPPVRSFIVAACAQVCVVFAVRGELVRASAALAACVAMLIAWWTRWDGHWARHWAGDTRALELGSSAVLLLMLLMTPFLGGGGGTSTVAAGSRAGGGPAQVHAPQTGQSGVDFVGIILWPPPKKKVDIVPPRPNVPVLGHGMGAKPLIIPFDGPYLYFKAPMTEPGPKAHVTFGDPTKANVQSTNWMPLRMEAHQNLGLPIDLDCCREMDVRVTNADNRTGRIDIALVLTDTASPGGKQLMLGDEPVLSSLTMKRTALDRAPVTETLKFAIPRTAGLRRFDEIDVIVQPSVERAKLGSRVAVEEFELVPR